MKLSQLTAKPQLIEVSIDDEDTIKEFGEAITFYTWDRQPMDIFMRLANATAGDTSSIISIVRTLILDEKGKEVLSEFIIGLTDDTGMSVKLKVDHFGNLIIANNITLGDLTITSEEVSSSRVSQEIKKYIKVLHMDVEYALPLHEINE
jgi:hypothetical protein